MGTVGYTCEHGCPGWSELPTRGCGKWIAVPSVLYHAKTRSVVFSRISR
jgi:hypothetical protein